jgi:hypothetical protein
MDTNITYLTLRKSLGILGLFLPLILWTFNGFELMPSISHFYYSHSSIFFTSIFFAFGLFLFSYRGRLKEKEWISDNIVTNIGGFMAIAAALIPTAFCRYCDDPIIITNELANFCCGNGLTIQFVHNNSLLGGIHFFCAATFLVIMGIMSFFRFTNGNTSSKKKVFYRICGIGIWTSLATIGLLRLFKVELTNYDVFIGECFALAFFGVAWIVKGKTFKKFGF